MSTEPLTYEITVYRDRGAWGYAIAYGDSGSITQWGFQTESAARDAAEESCRRKEEDRRAGNRLQMKDRITRPAYSYTPPLDSPFGKDVIVLVPPGVTMRGELLSYCEDA